MPIRIEPDSEPIPGYRLIERIGGGGFGEVWRAEAPGGLAKAIKVIHGDVGASDPESSRKAEQELRALKRVQAVRHPYLLSLERYDVVDGRLLIVMELADCNLWDRFREYRAKNMPGIPRAELLRYMEETAEVLDMMIDHYQLQHLDIKPQNLFLIYNHVKVADFGLVKDLEGVRAKVTGGVTPVYAAPETFDGVVTRYCDQYSLAIVYQELLCGVRPFNGATMQQLLMQHLHGTPDLTYLPTADRPAIARALAKKPEDRHPSCLAMVRSLMQLSDGPATVSMGGLRADTNLRGGDVSEPSPPNHPPAAPLGNPAQPSMLIGGEMWAPSTSRPVMAPMETPVTQFHKPPPAEITLGSAAEFVLPEIAAPEQTGSGALRPALIVGLGHSGLQVLYRFRRHLVERYGSVDNLPAVRMLFIDTDPETVQSASTTRSRASLGNDEVITARLNRPTHYLKPRRGGRSLIEGWFDPQMLYRIPRNPLTLGMRALGRLAFCDHARSICQRLAEALKGCTHPDAISVSERHARLGLRTNRPVVYIVASLGGGTGGGMYLDTAFATRQMLRRMGYPEPEVRAILLLPAVDNSPQRVLMMGNCYASLVELNHFSRKDTTYNAFFDDSIGPISDTAPPFQQVSFFGLPAAPNSVHPEGQITYQRAADALRRELFSLFGRSADKAREQIPPNEETTPIPTIVANFAAFSWPRQELLSQASYWLCVRLLNNWLASKGDEVVNRVQRWTTEQWLLQELNPESVIARLQHAVESQLGQQADVMFQNEAEQFVPRGWLSRSEPDKSKLWQTMTRLQQLIGVPDELGLKGQMNQIDAWLQDAIKGLTQVLRERLARLAPALIDMPEFRLVGAEEAVRQLSRGILQMIEHYEPLANELGKKALDAYFLLNRYLSGEPTRKRVTAAEIAEAVRHYPKWRYESLVLRQVVALYGTLRTQMNEQLREIQFCRQRLEDLAHHFHETRMPPSSSQANLLPVGCASLEEAVERLIKTLGPDDLRTLDRRAQERIEQEFNALFDVCMNSVNMIDDLRSLLLAQTRSFLNSKLGEADVVDMFLARFPNPNLVIQTLQEAYYAAQPPLIRPTPTLASHELSILAIPPGDQGERFQMFAHRAFGGVDLHLAPHADEILIHREYFGFPLIELPQLGTIAANAYGQVCGQPHFTPHTRIDIVPWADVEQ